MTPVVVTKPFNHNLTAAWLKAQGLSPFYAGFFWCLRLHLKDNDTGLSLDLDDSTVVMTLHYGDVRITRKSGVTSVDGPTAQVVFDDQSSEVGNTGTGWLTIFFYPVADEIEEMLTVLDDIVTPSRLIDYEVALKMPDDIIQVVVLSGLIEILRSHTETPIP